MTITLKIETHAYVEERLYDEILDENLPDDIQSCGIAGPEIIVPLRRNRFCEMVFGYISSTTIGEVCYAVLHRLNSLNHGVRVAFLYDGKRFWIDNLNANFEDVLKKYLDPNNTGILHVGAYISLDAGTIEEEDGIRYYMNSRERGKHHEAHVHICDTGRKYEAVVIIKDGRVIGDIPSKLAKKARKKVLENQTFFLENWNALTDGLRVDVNHFLGTIHY